MTPRGCSAPAISAILGGQGRLVLPGPAKEGCCCSQGFLAGSAACLGLHHGKLKQVLLAVCLSGEHLRSSIQQIPIPEH